MTDTYTMACPSEVDVPRSSSATSELRVAEDCINHKKIYQWNEKFSNKFIMENLLLSTSLQKFEKAVDQTIRNLSCTKKHSMR